MEPFRLTLEQVTFEENDPAQHQHLYVDSFDAVVNYDSSFQDSDCRDSSGSSQSDLRGCYSNSQYTSPVYTQSTVTLSSSISSVQHSRNSIQGIAFVEKNLDCDQFLVNPNNDCLSSSETAAACRTESRDVAFLNQISANTSAVSRHIKPQKKLRFVGRTTVMSSAAAAVTTAKVMSSEDSQSEASLAADKEGDGSNTFETVAEALRLQWSVIGNKDIAPAPPDVVAQIVAEAEKKMKLSGLANSDNSVSGLQTESQERFADEDKEIKVFTSPSEKLQVDHNSVVSEKSASVHASLDNNHHPPHDRGDMLPRKPELIPIPAAQLTTMKEKASWFSSKDAKGLQLKSESDKTSKPKHHKKGNVNSLSNNSSDLSGFQKTGNGQQDVTGSSVSSDHVNSSDVLSEKSLDMNSFGFEDTPYVKDPSFTPAHQSAADNLHTDSGVDLNLSINHPVKSSTPFSTKSRTPTYVLPDIEPLFPKIPGQHRPLDQSKPPNVFDLSSSSDIQKKLNTVMKEKAKLEGQLEVLTNEAQSTLQERADLQAQLASLRLKILSRKSGEGDPEKNAMKQEVEHVKKSRDLLEQSLQGTQQLLEEKIEELKILSDELQMSQESTDKLQLKMKDVHDNLKSKEITIQALKNKVAELYIEVQTVLQNKMDSEAEIRAVKSDIASLMNSKDWYQQQLQLAHEVRSQLQRELTMLQAQTVSQTTIVERLKMENGRLRQQLNESHQKALKQKEVLAKHLEAIESDMMEREASYLEIQRERSMIEETFNTKLQLAEDEKSRLSLLMQINNDLETQLDKTQENLKKKHTQIYSLENEQMELMKKLTLYEENILEKDKVTEELNQKLIEVENQLRAFQSSISSKDMEVLKLKEEKAATEIALKSALQEKAAVDSALDLLKGDLSKVEKSFKQMKQELGVKDVELERLSVNKKELSTELGRLRKDLSIKNKSYDTMQRDFDGKSLAVQQMQMQKAALENEVSTLKEKLETVQKSLQIAHEETTKVSAELDEVREHFTESSAVVSENQKLQSMQLQQSSAIMSDNYQQLLAENEALRGKLSHTETQHERLDAENVEKIVQLQNDLSLVKNDLSEKQRQFDADMESLKSQLNEVVVEKQKLETELEMTHRKFELSTGQHQGQMEQELQTLASELQATRLREHELVNHLHLLQQSKDAEISDLRQELSALESELMELKTRQAESERKEALHIELELELEKERGRLAGLVQNNSALKHHVGQVEEALARRESSLVELHTRLQETVSSAEQREQDYIARIQGIEETLHREKASQRDLRKQIGTKITENKRLRKQTDTIRQEQEQLKVDLQVKEQEVTQLQTDIEHSRQVALSCQGEVANLEARSHSLEHELERVKQELADNLARNPVLMEQIQSLQWQLAQKMKDVEQVQEQMRLAEQRQTSELEIMKKTLQDKQDEVDALQSELASSRQEKINQRSRVTELRSALKSTVSHHKLTKKLQSRKKDVKCVNGEDKETQVDLDDMITIPPLPLDLEAVEKLLEDTAVRTLDSRPLDNLQTCLSSLRAEISGLQKQMDVHTTVVHTSTENWRSIESEVNALREVVKTIANTALMDTATTATATDCVEADSDLMHV
ncbi:golgin subfamily A member 3-like [Gigantopelta aegis]|uniref:golgin subfamily A member 3-like n=1 Tax=Gigantopelta aegis TaxID=1735272 RepID=UPI001B88AAB7|nr:golgin subfamily A member 3-like [Gigantopelta aegis]